MTPPARKVRYALAPPDPIYREIGERIRLARKARGMTVEALGNAVGVQRGYFTLWEAGTRRIYAHHLAAIARALNMDVGALYPDSDVEPIRYTLTATADSPIDYTLTSSAEPSPDNAA